MEDKYWKKNIGEVLITKISRKRFELRSACDEHDLTNYWKVRLEWIRFHVKSSVQERPEWDPNWRLIIANDFTKNYKSVWKRRKITIRREIRFHVHKKLNSPKSWSRRNAHTVSRKILSRGPSRTHDRFHEKFEAIGADSCTVWKLQKFSITLFSQNFVKAMVLLKKLLNI